MSQNSVFCEAIKDLLGEHGRLHAAALYPLVEARIPDWCGGNYRKAVDNALKFMSDRGQITHDEVPGYSRRYIYRLPR